MDNRRELREQIIKLIASIDVEKKDKESKTAKKIIAIYKENPDLLEEKFPLGRTVFHLIVRKNLSYLLTKLLENKSWSEKSAIADNHGQNILHYCAAQKLIEPDIAKIILNYIPALANQRDELGNTALHIAIISKHNWMVEFLAGQPYVDRLIKNDAGECAFDLAGKDKSLKLLLLRLDFTAIKSLDARTRANSSESIETLRSALPLLSSTRSESSGSRSTSSSQTSSTSIIYEKISQGEEQSTIKNIASHAEDELINSMNQLVKEITYHLTLNGLTITPNNISSIDKDIFTERPTLETIWLLIAAYDEDDEGNIKREFSLENDITKNRTLGMLAQISLYEFLMDLRKLYNHFDYHQKLVANYVVSRLLQFDVISHEKVDGLVDMQLRFFMLKNVDKKVGLGELGESINQCLNKMISQCKLYSNYPRQKAILGMAINFDDLVEDALALSRPKRIGLVNLIADALRMITIGFYQDVNLKEFGDCCWMKKDASEKAPNITVMMDLINKISYYFIGKILNQKPENVKNALKLMVEITKSLCGLCGDNYPDLHHAVMFSVVFNNGNISRLTNYFSLLAKEDVSVIEELQCVTNQKLNYGFMSNIQELDQTALPYLGISLGRLCAVNEMENVLDKHNAMGVILLNIIAVKLKVSFIQVNHRTNILSFFQQYEIPAEEIRDGASQVLQPRASELSSVKSEENMSPKLERRKSKMFLIKPVAKIESVEGGVSKSKFKSDGKLS